MEATSSQGANGEGSRAPHGRVRGACDGASARFRAVVQIRLGDRPPTAETLIKWEHVNWDVGMIWLTGKRGLPVSTPITPEIAAILTPLIGHHPEAVFTYACKRPKKGQRKGDPYPITYAGAKSEWQATRARSGVTGFRFHDIRHDFATKLPRETRNLKLVSRALNHMDVKTTARYAHVTDGEAADALQRLSQSRKKSHVKSHAGKLKSA